MKDSKPQIEKELYKRIYFYIFMLDIQNGYNYFLRLFSIFQRFVMSSIFTMLFLRKPFRIFAVDTSFVFH